MGRVAKYKKIKSFDPFSKTKKGSINGGSDVIWGLGDNGRKVKQRSRTAERLYAKKNKQKNNQQINHNRLSRVDDNKDDRNGGFDLPPTSHQDEFDLADLMGSVTKEAVSDVMLLNDEPEAASIMVAKTEPAVAASTAAVATSSSLSNTVQSKNMLTNTASHVTSNYAINNKTNVDDETKVARLLKLDRQLVVSASHQSSSSSLTSSSLHRLPGESKRAYQKRTRLETRQIIHQTTRDLKKNAEKVQKKKAFLNQKKKQKRKLGQYNNEKEDDDGDVFDERVAGIPARNTDPVRFGEQAERPPTFRQLPRGALPNKNNKKLQNTLPTQQQQQQQHQHDYTESFASKTTTTVAEMEQLRRKVQAQYASVRAKRRQVGDGFHL